MTVKERAGRLQENTEAKNRGSVVTKTNRRPGGNSQPGQSNADSWESWSPILYRLLETSIVRQVVERMFSDRSEGAEDGSRTTTTWKEFVTAMGASVFSAEPNRGSIYRLCGAILVPDPNANPKRQKGKLSIHRHHANGDMDPKFLQAIGKRCTRILGWERNLFVGTDDIS